MGKCKHVEWIPEWNRNKIKRAFCHDCGISIEDALERAEKAEAKLETLENIVSQFFQHFEDEGHDVMYRTLFDAIIMDHE